MTDSRVEHFDVVIVGAGLSGIGAACRLETMCPTKSYAILESRPRLGGTWDLFRFPGIRSDSDMFTLSYPFRPWKDDTAIADGASILDYLRQTATEFGVDRHIRYDHHVTNASWSSSEGRWTIEAIVDDGAVIRCTGRFLYLCSGYYSYAGGHRPEFPGADTFAGSLIHPQEWPVGLDYAQQRVVIIGSGATAMTMAPAMAGTAGHVTVLQRSPSYIISLPAVDPLWAPLRRVLPAPLAFRVMRAKNLVISTALYQLCQRRPRLARRLLQKGVAGQLPDGYDIDPDFTPGYDPWDQRLCIVPDGDLFEAIRVGKVSIVTGRIARLTPGGIRLESGAELEADLIISATGLTLIAWGGIQLEVDGLPIDPGRTFIYRGFMLGGIPNLAMCFGYTNASWTLRADLVSRRVCHLLNKMDREGATQAAPPPGTAAGAAHPLLDLSAGYVQRATDRLPKQGSGRAWKFRQNYLLDLMASKLGRAGLRLSFSSSSADQNLTPARSFQPHRSGDPYEEAKSSFM